MSDSPPGSPGWRPAVGQTSPRWPGWQLERKIGAGSVGQVWIARHLQTEATRIFKFCVDGERQQAFERELPRLQLIRQRLAERDDVVRLREIYAGETPYGLEIDHVESPDLALWARRQRGLALVPLETRLALLAATAKTVAAAHAAGILHQGLKPSNIFIAEREGAPRPLLADFGVAAIAAGQAAEPGPGMKSSAASAGDAASGPRLYDPPETLAGSPATTAADIYALGVLLYQFVVGDLSRPFRSGWEADVADERLREDIAACTHHNPARRLASAAELAERLATLEPRREEREAQRIAARAATRAKRFKAALSAVAVGAFALAGWATYATYGWRRAEDEAREMQRLKQNADRSATEAREGESEARDSARANAELAEQQNQLALDTLNAVLFDLQHATKHLAGGSEVRRRLLESVLARFEQLSEEFVRRSEIDRSKLIAFMELGDAVMELGVDPTNAQRADAEPADAMRRAIGQEGAGPAAAIRLYQQAAGIAEKLAEESPDDLQAQRDLWQVYLRLGNACYDLGRKADALKYQQECLKIVRRLADADPKGPQTQRDAAMSHINLGNAKLLVGQTAAAAKDYQEAAQISRLLVNADLNDAAARRILWSSQINLGKVNLDWGKLTEALKHCQEAFEISRRLAELLPDDVQAQRDLLNSYERLSRVLNRAGQTEAAQRHDEAGLTILRGLAKSDPGNVRIQNDLAVTCFRVGDVAEEAGQHLAALKQFEEGLQILRRLAEAHPDHVGYRNELLRAYERAGAIARNAGQNEAALKHLADSLDIFRRLAAANPSSAQAQRNLAVTYDRAGAAAQKAGQSEAAFKYFGSGLEIFRRLAEARPGDVRAQRDLAICFQMTGEAAESAGEAAAAIENYQHAHKVYRRMAAGRGDDADIQRSLAHSCEKLGDAILRAGQADAALQIYQEELAAYRQIAEAAPDDLQARRGVTICYERLGDIAYRKREIDVARKYYEDGMEIRRRLVEADPDGERSRRELSVFYERLGNVALETGRIEDALKFDHDCLEIRRSLAEASPNSAQAQHDLSIVHFLLARAERQRFEYEAALAQCQKAQEAIAHALELGRRQELVKRLSQNVEELATTCATAVVAVAGLQQIEQAEADNRPRLYALRCSELARRGDAAAVAEAADKLRELAGEDADRLYAAACGYSLCVRVFDAPPRGGVFLPPEQPQQLSADDAAKREKYLKLALEMLERAVAAGFKDAARLRLDSDLIPLRETPEFKQLLESMGGS